MTKDRWIFKGKRIHGGGWYEGNVNFSISNGYNDCCSIRVESCFSGLVIVETDTLCQCTGIKDASGKLIFENDIVKLTDRAGNVDYAKVKWRDGFAAFMLCFGWDGDDFLFPDTCDDIEVVGNIIDDPTFFERERGEGE